jgi:hypothetical protein
MRHPLVVTLLLATTPAIADEAIDSTRREASPPRSPAVASLALPAHKLSLALTAEIETGAGKLGEPVALAPDVAYGVTRDLTVSLVHSKFAVTGFRAVTGGGFCLGGDAACPHVYNNAGAEALYSLRRGPFAVAAIGGAHAMDFDAGFVDAKLGLRARYAHGRASLLASPSVLIALTERTDAMGARRNKDLLYVPVLASYKLIDPLAIGIGSGVKGSLTQLGSTWEVPLGVVASYAVDPSITIGASFVFGKLIGGADDPAMGPPATGADFRGTQLWVVVVR